MLVLFSLFENCSSLKLPISMKSLELGAQPDGPPLTAVEAPLWLVGGPTHPERRGARGAAAPADEQEVVGPRRESLSLGSREGAFRACVSLGQAAGRPAQTLAPLPGGLEQSQVNWGVGTGRRGPQDSNPPAGRHWMDGVDRVRAGGGARSEPPGGPAAWAACWTGEQREGAPALCSPAGRWPSPQRHRLCIGPVPLDLWACGL